MPLAISLLLLFLVQDTPESHLGRGYDALKQNRFAEAATEFGAALQLDPQLASRARFPLAVALFFLKDTTAARREFDAVRQALGDQPNTSYYLGRIDIVEQKYGAAIRNLNRAISRPPFPDTAYHLGFAYLKQGDLANAEKWLNTAAKATPGDPAISFQLAQLYRRQGRDEDAARALAQSEGLRRATNEDAEVRQQCVQKLEQGPKEEAHAVCQRLFDPNDADKLTALGTIYGQHGDPESALEPLRRAAELVPSSPQMQYNLAYTYYKLGRFEEARSPIAQAAERWPDLFQLNSLYAVVLLSLGKPAEAWPILRRAHQLNVQDAKVVDALYQTSMALGRSTGEKRYFEEALKLRPGDPDARRAMASPNGAK